MHAAERGGPFDRIAAVWRERHAAVRPRRVESSPLGGLRVLRRGVALAAALLALAGTASLGGSAFIYGKAAAGQWLLQRAWAATLATHAPMPPWPWADTHPIARLVVPAQKVDLLVLAGASGRTLAWGPGHLDGSAEPGDDGNSVLSAHRDTHFRFLEHTRLGDTIVVERGDGSARTFRVRSARVVDVRALAISRDADLPTLTLVTCYPFDAVVPGGPLRYVVTAVAAEDRNRDGLM